MKETEIVRLVRKIALRVANSIEHCNEYGGNNPRAQAAWIRVGGMAAIFAIANGCNGSAVQHAIDEASRSFDAVTAALPAAKAAEEKPASKSPRQHSLDFSA